MHFVTGVRESRAEIATDATGSEDGELHDRRTTDGVKGTWDSTRTSGCDFPRKY